MAAGGVPRASGSRTVGSVEDIALDSGCRLIRCGDPVCGMLHEFGEVGYLLHSGNRSGIGLVGRSPWTAANASSACWQASQGAGGGRGRPPHIAPQNVGYLSQADTLILRFFWSRYPTSFAKREPGRTMV